ncbi:monothiol glutaredoxin-S1, mitochondrial-like [Miscanthus floridulus]|uniref:monothiol glutaredoxin-S1, mitochondrial-like n=1 Tax=Miscanthus floridulus TaxID=154761 RepID=UPI00345A1CFC
MASSCAQSTASLFLYPGAGPLRERLGRRPRVVGDARGSRRSTSSSSSTTSPPYLSAYGPIHTLINMISRTGSTILIYVKGYPEASRCGVNALAVRVLQQYGLFYCRCPHLTFDILSHLGLNYSIQVMSSSSYEIY